MKVFKFLAHSEKEMLLRIIEETDMRSERQISDVFSNKYKFIDEENVGIIVKCRSVNTECQPSSDKVITNKIISRN